MVIYEKEQGYISVLPSEIKEHQSSMLTVDQMDKSIHKKLKFKGMSTYGKIETSIVQLDSS